MDDSIIKLAKGLIECYEKAYEIYKIDVDNIINNGIVDIQYIEQTLDHCLDIYTEKGFYLFLKLLFYYSTVNLENSYAYINILKETRSEEYNEYVKKLEKTQIKN